MFRTYRDVMRTSKQDAEDSEEDEHKDSLHICGICTDGWTSETEVALHQASKHRKHIRKIFNKDDETLCKMCIREFPDYSKLVKHIKSAHLLSSEKAIRVEREIFACDLCSAIFFNKMMLAHHMVYSHMPNKSAEFQCPVCFKNLRVPISWYHFRVHRLQSISSCKICFKKTKDLKRLTEHMKSHAMIYKCEMCAYETKKEEFFREHIQTVHKRHTQDMMSIDVDKYFILNTKPQQWKPLNLMAWRGVKLTNNFNICVLCRQICVGEEEMKQHILLDHMYKRTVITNYLCSCGMLFSSKVLLKHHRFKFREEHDD